MREGRRRARICAAGAMLLAIAIAACGLDQTGLAEPPAEGGALAETGTDVVRAVDSPSDAPASDATLADGRADALADVVVDAPREADAFVSTLSPDFVYRDVNQVLGTGQSLSVGTLGSPVLTTTQPYSNLMFVTGVMAESAGLTSFLPLVEGDLIPGTGSRVETMSSSFANLVTKVARNVILVGQPAGQTSHDLLVSQHGVGSTTYAGLKKGTAPYATGIAQAQAGHDLAVAAGQSHVVRVVTNVHGETDSDQNNTAYEDNLIEWQSDYETDVQAITGQADPIPMLITQFSSWTARTGFPTTSIIPSAMLAAHVDAPGKIVLVGAKYHLPYAADGVHLSNDGYRHMGEDYAKVYRRVILEGKPWEPIHPKSITRVGAVVTVQMHVPAPPLVLDTALVSNPGHFGFEWADDGPTPSIVSVALAGADTVTITLSATPTGDNPRLRYAFTGASGALGGAATGPRGNLRDSDITPSRNGYALYNWCVHFDVEAP